MSEVTANIAEKEHLFKARKSKHSIRSNVKLSVVYKYKTIVNTLKMTCHFILYKKNRIEFVNFKLN